MSETAIRQSIIDHCRAMNASGLNQGTSGNISVRQGGRMLITPSGIPYDKTTPDMIASLSLDSDGAYDGPKKPSVALLTSRLKPSRRSPQMMYASMARPSGQNTMKPITISAMVAGVQAGRINADVFIFSRSFC